MSEFFTTVPDSPRTCYICAACPGGDAIRPYGPNCEWICWDCMNATPESRAAARKVFGEILDGEREVPS